MPSNFKIDPNLEQRIADLGVIVKQEPVAGYPWQAERGSVKGCGQTREEAAQVVLDMLEAEGYKTITLEAKS